MKSIFAIFVLATSTVGCASQPHATDDQKVQFVDNKIDVKATMGRKDIGVDDSGVAVIQETTAVQDVLRQLQWENFEAQRKINSDGDRLKECRNDYASPRLGGNKKNRDVMDEALKQSKAFSKTKTQVGLDETGKLVVVTKVSLNKKIEEETTKKESLERAGEFIAKTLDQCETELGDAREARNLPRERYPAKGHYGPGGLFVTERPAERNLDDAFRIQAEESAVGKRLEKADRAPAQADEQ